MAYDEGLAQRIREHIGTPPGLAEKEMFGSLAFLYQGNMTVGVIGEDLIARVAPDRTETALARPGARPFDLTGRPMRGSVVVGAAALGEDEVLDDWIEESLAYTSGLPPK